MHFFTNPGSLNAQSAGGFGFGPINTATSGPPELTKKFDISATFTMSADDKLYACQDSMMVVQPYRRANNTIHPDLVNVILQPISGLGIPFSTVRYYVIRGVRKSSFVSGTTIVNNPSTNTEFITKFWANWNQYKIDTSQPTLLDPGPNALGFEDATATMDNRPLAKIFNNSYSPLSAVKVTEGQWIANLKQADVVSFEVITSVETVNLDIEYLRKHKYEINVTSLMAVMPVTDESAFNLRAEREKILSYLDPAALFGMHFDYVVTLGDTKVPKTGAQIYTDLLNKFSTKNRLYIDVRSEKGYSYNFYLAYNDGSGNRMRIKYGGTASYVDTPYYTNDWPIFYTDLAIATDVFSTMDIQLRKDDNPFPLLLIENGKLQGVTTPVLKDTPALFPAVGDWSTDIFLQVPNYDNGGVKENISHHITLNYFRITSASSKPEVIKNMTIWNSNFGALDTSKDITTLAFNHVRNEKKLLSRVVSGAHVSQSGVFFDTSNALLYSEKTHTYKSSGRTYPTVDFTRLNANKVIANSLFPKNMSYNKWQITVGGSPIDILEITGANTGSVYTDVGDIYILGLTKVELGLLQNATGLSPLHQKYISFDPAHGVDDNGVFFQKYNLKVVGLNLEGKEDTVMPSTTVAVYGSGGSMLCSQAFAASIAIPNLLRDPVNLIEWAHVGSWSYNSNDAEVQAVDSIDGDIDGVVKISDLDNYLLNRQVDLTGEVYYPADVTDGSLSTVKTTYPLVVIVHGNGHRYTNYRELARFLALNGFIVASINCLIYTGKRRYKLTASGDPTWDYYFGGADGYVYFYNSTTQELMILTEDIHTGVQTPTVLNQWVINVDFEIKTTSGGTPKRIIFIKKLGTGGMASLGRANLVPLHLKILKAKFTTNVEDNIGILGHSRGGEAVVRAAKDVNSTVAHPNLSQIKAVMSLAPTDIWDKEKLTNNIPYFVLYGSKDGDVSGRADYIRAIPIGSVTGGGEYMGSGAFSLFDRANNNTSKSMTFVYGATHNGFINNNNDYKDNTRAPLEEVATQKMICRGYANAFFRRHLLGETEWNELLQGHYIPPSIPTKNIYQQYQDMSASTIVVDNFEGTTSPTSWATNSLGKPVTYTGTAPQDGVFRNGSAGLDTFSPHDTQGLKLVAAGGEELNFTISTTGLNVQTLTYLSFRISKVANPGSAYKVLDTLLIRLKDISGNTKEVNVNQRIPDPDPRFDIVVVLPNGDEWRDYESLTKSALMTIRMPLVDFVPGGIPANVDLTQVSDVTFIFPSTFSGSVDMDSIEFTN